MVKNGNNYYGDFWFVVDNNRVAYMEMYEDTDATPTPSATINLELTAGQIVRIESNVSTEIYGTHADGFIFSWFTGFLMFAV